MLAKLGIVLLIEVAYALCTRVWLRQYFDGIPLELYTTAIRALTAAFYWLLFREVIQGPQPQYSATRDPVFAVGILIALLVPMLVGDQALPDLPGQVVFALTSIVVGLREELAYRGVVQNLLERRLGWIGAIIISNILFVAYHYGAQPFSVPSIVEFFTMGCVLGCIYCVTRSLWLVIAIHAVYDAMWAFPPLVEWAFPRSWGVWMQLVALVLIAAWAWRAHRGLQPRQRISSPP